MIKVKVPATTANLGPGLDTLGLALSLYLTVEMDISGQGNIINYVGIDSDELSKQPDENLILQSARFVLKQAGFNKHDLLLNIYNEIPVGKGLGSSASAIVAGMYAANRLINSPFSDEQLLSWAVKMEGHADNIVPAVVGGLCTVMLQGEYVFYQKIAFPSGLKLILAVPDFSLSTSKSRTVLPQKIDLQDAVSGLQRACFLLGCLANDDYSLLAAAMQDPVFQAGRQDFIPGFNQVTREALNAGAKGVTISGAGPSIIAFAADRQTEIGEAMRNAFALAGIKSSIHVLNSSTNGLVYLT